MRGKNTKKQPDRSKGKPPAVCPEAEAPGVSVVDQSTATKALQLRTVGSVMSFNQFADDMQPYMKELIYECKCSRAVPRDISHV
jgi:hypothetical protein